MTLNHTCIFPFQFYSLHSADLCSSVGNTTATYETSSNCTAAQTPVDWRHSVLFLKTSTWQINRTRCILTTVEILKTTTLSIQLQEKRPAFSHSVIWQYPTVIKLIHTSHSTFTGLQQAINTQWNDRSDIIYVKQTSNSTNQLCRTQNALTHTSQNVRYGAQSAD